MSFPRAAFKRFNETTDDTIPPLGAYNPKFMTDVAVTSTLKAGSPLGSAGVANPFRSRSSSGQRIGKDNEPDGSQIPRFTFNNKSISGGASGRISRNPSNTTFTRLSRRRSSTTGITAAGSSGGPPDSLMTRRRSTTRVVSRTAVSKSVVQKARSPSGTRTSGIALRRAPSTTVSRHTTTTTRPEQVFMDALTETLKSEGMWNTSTAPVMGIHPPPKKYDYEWDGEMEPGEVRPEKMPPPPPPQRTVSLLPRGGGPTANSGGNIFDEIQTLAESLQNELSEYKQKLGKERIRSQELEAKKVELEFINHSFKRQLEKYEGLKESWEYGQLNNRSIVEDLTREKGELEEKLAELQKKLEKAEESEFNLQEKVTQLEERKIQWAQEKINFEVQVDQLKTLLKEEEVKKTEVEEKIRELEAQMDSCYHTCESRMTDTENMKETYEVKIQELTEQVEELSGKLEAMRRELETQKTLMQLMKDEQEGKDKKMEEFDNNKIDNYIC